MQPLSEIFPLLASQYPDLPEVQEAVVMQCWSACVGEKIREVTRPKHFRKGVLAVEVPRGQWQSIIASLKDELIARLNARIKKNLVREIKLVMTSE